MKIELDETAKAVADRITGVLLHFSSRQNLENISMNWKGPPEIQTLGVAIHRTAHKVSLEEGTKHAPAESMISSIFSAPMSSPAVMLVDAIHHAFGLPLYGVDRIEGGVRNDLLHFYRDEHEMYHVEILQDPNVSFSKLPAAAQAFALTAFAEFIIIEKRAAAA